MYYILNITTNDQLILKFVHAFSEYSNSTQTNIQISNHLGKYLMSY